MLLTWVRWSRRRLRQNQAGFGSIENYLALCPHICMPLHYQLVLDNFSNFRLYGQHRRGATAEQLAIQHKMSAVEVTERIEAGRLCMEKQVRVEDVHAPCRTVDSIA